MRIAGLYAYREPAPPVDNDELTRIREHMARPIVGHRRRYARDCAICTGLRDMHRFS